MNENELKIDFDSGIIREGKAEILEPPGKKVFYNPVQEFNRDLSVLCLQILFNEFIQSKKESNNSSDVNVPFRILEALSATGLRSIRYAKEIPGVTQVVANDISLYAIQNIESNVKHNKVEHIVQLSHCDAVTVMHNHKDFKKRFEAVDLDPYGSPTQFLDSAVQSVVDGGLLLVTCTDMAVLCGISPETCFVKYGAVSLKIPASHEMAIRIVLQSIQSHASRYKRYIVPQLSVSVDFYIRVFVKIYTSASVCKQVTSNLSMVYHCTSCHAITLQPLGLKKKAADNKNFKYTLPHAPSLGMKCAYCNGNHHMGGPIWSGPIHNETFVNNLLKSDKIAEMGTSKRLSGVLSVIREELDVPLYHSTAKLSSVLKCSTIPTLTLRSAILNANYRVSYSHAYKQSIKTDAPMSFIWDVMKEWLKETSSHPKSFEASSPPDNILKLPVQHEIDFSLRPDANPLSRELGLVRFQLNPLPYWGPGCKSTVKTLEQNPKKIKNQDKKRSRKRNTSKIPNKALKVDEDDKEIIKN